MAGLRERQKEKRFQAIIKAALLLIKEKGYGSTSIEEIAGKAEVGVGTVYNYFHTKAEIILEIYRRDVDLILKNGKEIIIEPCQNYPQMTAKLLISYAAGYYAGREKSLLREIYSVVMSEQSLACKELLQLDNLLVEQLANLLIEAQQKEQIRSQVSALDAAGLLFSVTANDLLVFITDEEMKFSELEAIIQRHIQLVFEGLSG
jgi:AcrR family transcriptional regulator